MQLKHFYPPTSLERIPSVWPLMIISKAVIFLPAAAGQVLLRLLLLLHQVTFTIFDHP